jgi:glutathione synthase/RimK-type ligase-like ATP-grasp enzyme
MNWILAKRGHHNSLLRVRDAMSNSVNIISPKRIPSIKTDDVVIRYGCATQLRPLVNIINPARGILLASNKLESKKRLITNNIKSIPVIKADFTTYKKIVGRPIKHSRGRKFFVCTSQEEVVRAKRKGAAYWMPYIEKHHEYRVHVAHGKVLLVQQKVNRLTQSTHFHCWNHHCGFVFEVIGWDRIPKGLCPLAVEAVECIGLDFGAVDVLHGSNGMMICEINTAPRLESYPANRYANYFDLLISRNGIMDHYEGTKKYIWRFEWRFEYEI